MSSLLTEVPQEIHLAEVSTFGEISPQVVKADLTGHKSLSDMSGETPNLQECQSYKVQEYNQVYG